MLFKNVVWQIKSSFDFWVVAFFYLCTFAVACVSVSVCWTCDSTCLLLLLVLCFPFFPASRAGGLVGVEDDSPVSACFSASAVVFLRSRGTFAACSCSLAAFWCREQLVLRALPSPQLVTLHAASPAARSLRSSTSVSLPSSSSRSSAELDLAESESLAEKASTPLRFFFFGILSAVGAGSWALACAHALAISFRSFALACSLSFFCFASLASLAAWLSFLGGIARNGQTVDCVVPELLGLKPLQLGN